VLWRDLARNETRSVNADHVLIADGKGSLIRAEGRPTSTFGIKAHFADVRGPRDAIELFGVNGHYGGLAPVEDDLWNASFAVPAARVQACRGDIEILWERIVSENQALSARMRGARLAGRWLASPLPRFGVTSFHAWPARVIPIGNAAAALEPIGGEGIGLAMRSAQLAAVAIAEAIDKNRAVDTRGLQHQFDRLWQVRRLACRAAGFLLSRPRLADWLTRSLQPGDLLPILGLKLAGKAGAPAYAATTCL
jgi:flavin-dependent dehydrogenase